ncbi:hypothetical protein C8F01DRAFT_1326168 [Mycena amicta]|nr:hypothetical protein C8F01DRAFT_1326168 [Mycena amicta]
MATALKTLVATGCSSGLGLEAIKQLLTKQPALSPPIEISKALLGVRNTLATTTALAGVSPVPTVLPLELGDLKSVKAFASKTLEILGAEPLDYLLLNAANAYHVEIKSKYGEWCEQYIVNHLSQHYLIHLLREKLVASGTRIVVVIGCHTQSVPGPSFTPNTYPETKFTQLLNAHYWRRTLSTSCTVVAVSPGMVPATGLTRQANFSMPANAPDAISVTQGATNILQALVRSDFPENSDQIFLTSWGEWWGVDVLEKTLDKELQDKWSPGMDEIEELMKAAGDV